MYRIIGLCDVYERGDSELQARDVLAVLYVIGAVTTVTGVLMAYRQAVKQKRAFDQLADLGRSDVEVEQGLAELGVEDRPPTWNDMRLPISYWSKRSALADTLSSFKTAGVTALAGVALSTIASVCSLYLT